MDLDEGNKASPIITMYQALQATYPQWSVAMGQLRGRGWIPGTGLLTAREGPLPVLLERIDEGLHTADRRTIAASSTLRYGWSSGMAIAPYLLWISRQ
jgi:hypothetical protein